MANEEGENLLTDSTVKERLRLGRGIPKATNRLRRENAKTGNKTGGFRSGMQAYHNPEDYT